MPSEFLLQLAALVGGMAATYAAIRADLATIRVEAERASRDADKAHERLDDHINDHMRRN